MSIRTPARWLLLTVVVLLAGCAHARYLERTGSHGVVAIPHPTNRWPSYNQDAAKKLMAEHFPQGYVIEDEREVVVGRKTYMVTSQDQSALVAVSFGPQRVNETVYHEDLREWHIRYRAKDAPPTSAPPGPPPPAPLSATMSQELPPAPVPVDTKQ